MSFKCFLPCSFTFSCSFQSMTQLGCRSMGTKHGEFPALHLIIAHMTFPFTQHVTCQHPRVCPQGNRQNLRGRAAFAIIILCYRASFGSMLVTIGKILSFRIPRIYLPPCEQRDLRKTPILSYFLHLWVEIVMFIASSRRC